MNNEEIDEMLLDESFKATFLASATQLNRDIQKLSLEHSNPIEAANIYAQELKDKLFVNTTQDEQHQLINKISMSYLIFARALETTFIWIFPISTGYQHSQNHQCLNT